MSEFNEVPSGKNNLYKHMSTEKLKDILRNSALSGEALELDVITEILDELDLREPDEPYMTTEEAWEEFQRDYIGKKSSYLHCAYDESAQTSPRKAEKPRLRHSSRALSRAAIIAIVIVGLLFVGTVTASALGFNLWSTIIEWGRETFGFRTEGRVIPNDESESGYADLQSALDDHGITQKVVPKISDEYELGQIEVIRQPGKTIFYASYTSDGNELIVSIMNWLVPPNADYEKDQPDELSSDDETLFIYEVSDIEHKITTNLDSSIAAWTNGNLECYISGNITKEELIQMIESIY